LHGYTTAFKWATVTFVVGCVSCGLLLRAGRNRQPNGAVQPAAAG
jgi:hypothetical protein